jgi:hypothetical protein
MPKGAHLGTTPLTYSMDASDGAITLTVKKRGYVDEQITVPAGRNTDQTLTLTRAAASRPRDPKSASGSAAPSEPAGTTLDPFDKLTSKPGPH